MQTDICERAMLAALTIRVWTARIFDRKVTAKANQDHAARRDAGRYHKCLLPGESDLRAIGQAANAARTAHYALTLPWSDDGWRMLPTDAYWLYVEAIRKHRATYETAVERFVAEYPTLRQRAPGSLGSMYRDSDYPKTVAEKFGFDVAFRPIPASGDLRVSLPADQVATLEREMAARTEAAVAEAMRGAWDRLYQAVAHIMERLGDPTAIFRDTLIPGLVDVCRVLGPLNVTKDPNLERLRADAERSLARYAGSQDVLRADPVARAQAAEEAARILGAMQAFYRPSEGP